MKPMNRFLFQTLSCRTTRTPTHMKPLQWLMLFALAGAVLGMFLRSRFPAFCDTPWMAQGLSVSAEVRTLWDVCSTALSPALLMLLGVLFGSVCAFGQVLSLLLVFWRGSALGNALCGCFLQLSAGDGFLAASVLVLPFGFSTLLLLAKAALEAFGTANAACRYLFRGISDDTISAKQTQLLTKLFALTMFTLLAGGLHTLLCWIMNGWLCQCQFIVHNA